MPEGHLPVRSYLAVPVVSRTGEVLGGLFFSHVETGVFTASHERLLAGIAGQAAVAIDNARLHQRTQATADRLSLALTAADLGLNVKTLTGEDYIATVEDVWQELRSLAE